MALPLDLWACASFDDTSDPAFSTPGTFGRAPRRSSRVIVIPAHIIERVRAHEVDALRELVRMVYAPLVRFARTIVHSHDEAEDVVQDVITFLWERGMQWDPGQDAAAYLFASVRNQALKELRRRVRAERRAIRAQDDAIVSAHGIGIDPSQNVLDRVVDAETDAARLEAVEAVLETCTERQRTAYDLRFHRGLTVPAIAEVLGITVKGAEQLVRRVTQLVLSRLKER
jgi:RNA polymerase sigma-70 factor (ECF subfamily)